MNILKKYRYILKNLDCAACARKIEDQLSKEKDLKNISVNFSTLNLSFETDKDGNVIEYIKELITKVEPEVEVIESKNEKKLPVSKNYFHFIRLLAGILLAGIGFYTPLPSLFQTIFVLSAYVVLLYRTCLNAIQLLFKSKTINENFLITISCIGAYLVGEHMEGLMVIILYEIGKILEEKAINNSRTSIAELMDIRPEYACLEDGRNVSPDGVSVGEIILVKAGEKIPLDGIILEGKSHLDTSSLTGESKLIKVESGDEVLSGSINQEGLMKVRVTKSYEDSTVSKILELVENATDKKAKTETFVNRASKIYTPIVLDLAILVGLFLPLFTDVSYSVSIYRALIFLVISCPCAIAISVPLSYFSGIGRASREGILIKGSDYLDSLKDIREIVFDKTGTLTTGNFGVTKVIVFQKKYQEQDILKYAVLGENFSNHPIAKSILNAWEGKIDTSQVKKYQEVAGYGISYQLEEKKIKIGNREYVHYDGKLEDGTNIFVSVDGVVIGSIILNDILKEDAKQAIDLLHEKNIHTRMFTGDNQEAALRIGKALGINQIKYEMLPDDKYFELEQIMKEYSKGEKVAFVGDGINDSPVLALADIGISMGGIGTSAAIEASDVVIMTDHLSKIIEAISISKVTDKIIKENLIFALATKIIILLLSVVGLSGMWQAIFADVGVTLITILNTLRILRWKKF